jgi:radical SAM protein with 4Fe4S-binding SPASM domain
VANIALGLHAEPFADPFLVARARKIRELFPSSNFFINTNGAHFSERRHGELFKYVNCVGVHIESLDPEKYNTLMAPLKLKSVLPKVEKMVAMGGDKVSLVIPIHKKNVDEYPELRAWWQSLGGGTIVPLPFTNRGALREEILEYHLFAEPGICRQRVAFDFIIDWDGEVLSCCQDFSKKSGIGDLREQTVAEVVFSKKRRDLFDDLKNQRWGKLEMCRNCLFDSQHKLSHMLETQTVQ